MLDTYEMAEHLDDWVCSQLVPSLPSGARLVIAGRNELVRSNFDWTDHVDEVDTRPLPELDMTDARRFLVGSGLDEPVLLDRILAFTGGYPLLLVLVRQLAEYAGGWANVGDLSQERDRDEVATGLLDRILREPGVGELRRSSSEVRWPSGSTPRSSPCLPRWSPPRPGRCTTG